jgi:iron complex outermembrane receptor protein
LKSGLLNSRDALDLRSSYTFANFRYKDDPVYANNFLPGQPKHMVRGELRYQANGFLVAPNLEWSAAAYFVNSPNTAQNGSWAVINLRAGYDWSKFGLFLEGVNLTNRYYSGSVIVDDAAGRFFEPGVPRSVYGGVRVRF